MVPVEEDAVLALGEVPLQVSDVTSGIDGVNDGNRLSLFRLELIHDGELRSSRSQEVGAGGLDPKSTALSIGLVMLQVLGCILVETVPVLSQPTGVEHWNETLVVPKSRFSQSSSRLARNCPITSGSLKTSFTVCHREKFPARRREFPRKQVVLSRSSVVPLAMITTRTPLFFNVLLMNTSFLLVVVKKT